MGEKTDKRIHRTLQESSNLSSVWHRGEASRTTLLSANSNNNCMGRSSRTLDDLHTGNGDIYEVYQGNEASRPEKISYQIATYFGKQNYENGFGCVGSPKNGECNGINERRKDREIYVRGISSKWNNDWNDNEKYAVPEQQFSSNVEGEKYSDIKMVRFECCPNDRRIHYLQLSLGKLLRIGVLVGNAWTKEKPKTPCHPVVPNVQYKDEKIPEAMSHVSKSEKQDAEGRNNPLMIVEMIANKSDRKRVAKLINHYVENEDPTAFKCYFEDVKAYGFDHIILIGGCRAGILFLDCYGRVFEWEDSMSVLWSLGDYLSMAEKESLTRRIIWVVEYDGTVTEFDAMDDLPNEPTFDKSATKTMDVHPVAKKKKNSKKKNSKKKKH